MAGDESRGVPAVLAVEARLHPDEANLGPGAEDQAPAANHHQWIVEVRIERPPQRGGRRLEPLSVGCAHAG